LDLPAGTIDDLTPLAELSSLETLRLRNNQVSQLQPLAGSSSLRFLDLQSNPVADGALAEISEVPLTNLYVGHTAITSLDDILLFEDLLALNISGLPIDDLSPLSGSGILTLWANETNISDLSFLSSWGPLACLFIMQTSVVDLSLLLEVDWVEHCETCPTVAVTEDNLDDYSKNVVIPTLCQMGINANACLLCPQ
jgi:internalin A